MDEFNSLFKQLILVNNNIDNGRNNDNNEKCNTCLISNELLDNNCIKLSCGHIFNYTSIYNEVVYQKTKKVGNDRYLKNNEIKCPYCRVITNNFLPYYKYYDVKQYSNFLKNDTSNNLQLNQYRCEYKFKSNIFCNNLACNTGCGNFCNKHLKYSNNDENILGNLLSKDEDIYKKRSVIELRKILKDNGCKVSGNKSDLISRIIINKNKKKSGWIE